MKFYLIVIGAAALALSGCGPDVTPDSETLGNSPRFAIGTKLDEDAQLARIQACGARLEHYRELRVWRHGGAKPGVDRAMWNQLKPEERAEIFDIAACEASGGMIAERFVTITEEGGSPEIETKRVANTRDFAKEFGASK